MWSDLKERVAVLVKAQQAHQRAQTSQETARVAMREAQGKVDESKSALRDVVASLGADDVSVRVRSA
jgi:hypothetical protein